MPRKEEVVIALSKNEAEIADKIAALLDMTREEAIAHLAEQAMAQRIRKNTGHRPARVYPLRKPQGPGK